MTSNKITISTTLLTVSLIVGAVMADEKPQAEMQQDEKALIEKSVQSYVAAYNAQDATALAAHWSDEGVYVDRVTGNQVKGRDALEKAFLANFQANKDARLDVEVKSIEFVSPSVAIEQGIATFAAPEGSPSRSNYSVVHVKSDGKWLIDRVSEEEIVPPPSNYGQLKDLEWMIGDWVDQSGRDVVATQCHWARNKNFLVRSFTISLKEEVKMAGMQVIGWDPATKQIRSWTFDSDGGFNEGTWQKAKEQWTVRTTATLPDGTRGSSTSIVKPLDENSFAWQRVNRVVGGELLPNIEEIVIVRTVPE